MKKLVVFSIILFVAMLMLSVSCAKVPASNSTQPPVSPAPPANTPETPPPGLVPPGTPGAANDDIVYPPGGFTYRSNVHQQGQPDWPPVPQNEITLATTSSTIDIQYREYIETKAGETRNNIIFLNGRSAPDISDPLQINYVAVGLPDGISIQKDQKMYGGIGGQDKKSARVVLKIFIASQVKPGEYPFSIHLEYDGKEIGSIPCTVKVLE
jgi:hypothetical protein